MYKLHIVLKCCIIDLTFGSTKWFPKLFQAVKIMFYEILCNKGGDFSVLYFDSLHLLNEMRHKENVKIKSINVFSKIIKHNNKNSRF